MTKKTDTADYKPIHEGYQPEKKGYQPQKPSTPQGGTSKPQSGYTPAIGQGTKPTPPKKP